MFLFPILLLKFFLLFQAFHAIVNSKYIFLFYCGQKRPQLSVHYSNFISGFVMVNSRPYEFFSSQLREIHALNHFYQAGVSKERQTPVVINCIRIRWKRRFMGALGSSAHSG